MMIDMRTDGASTHHHRRPGSTSTTFHAVEAYFAFYPRDRHVEPVGDFVGVGDSHCCRNRLSRSSLLAVSVRELHDDAVVDMALRRLV